LDPRRAAGGHALTPSGAEHDQHAPLEKRREPHVMQTSGRAGGAGGATSTRRRFRIGKPHSHSSDPCEVSRRSVESGHAQERRWESKNTEGMR
jgi:hypothetical protein